MFANIRELLEAIFEALKAYLNNSNLDSVFDLLLGLVRSGQNAGK
jgi:hypothetical protein